MNCHDDNDNGNDDRDAMLLLMMMMGQLHLRLATYLKYYIYLSTMYFFTPIFS